MRVRKLIWLLILIIFPKNEHEEKKDWSPENEWLKRIWGKTTQAWRIKPKPHLWKPKSNSVEMHLTHETGVRCQLGQQQNLVAPNTTKPEPSTSNNFCILFNICSTIGLDILSRQKNEFGN